MDDIIQEIQDNLTRKKYLSALGLTLILPDICGKIAYPDTKSTGKRYSKWYDKYIYAYEHLPNEKQLNPLNGIAVYKLRCMFLHEGSNDLNEFLRKKAAENFSEYTFIFTDTITKFNRHWASGQEDQKTIDIQINLVDFCNKICWTAENFYKVHSEEYIFKNIIFSFTEEDYN